MRYSKHYTKLDKNEYTTIRRYKKKRKVGDIEDEILIFTFLHKAQIMEIVRQTFNDMSTVLLLEDTDCKTRDEAYDLIQAFYQKPINREKEKLFIFYMKKEGNNYGKKD